MIEFTLGQTVRMRTVVKDVLGTPQNATMVLRVMRPNGTVLTPGTTNSGTGVYFADVLTDDSGTWSYRWEASGAVTTAEEGQFYVRPSSF